MSKQAIVVGLGQFGSALSRSLTARGVEVLAIDTREDLVRAVAPDVSEALSMDATDEPSLASLAPARRDLCVVAIGEESRESSIICTALLRQMGAPRVIVRAMDSIHERILRLVGAHDVVNPEREFGERLASRIMFERVVGELPLGNDLLLTEMSLPAAFAGHTLSELGLPRRFGVTVLLIRRAGKSPIVMPEPEERLQPEDIIVVVSREGSVQKLVERSQ